MLLWILAVVSVIPLTFSLAWRRLYIEFLKRVFDYAREIERRCYVRDGTSPEDIDGDPSNDSNNQDGYIIRYTCSNPNIN